MKRLKLIGVLMAGVAMVVLSGSGVHAQYDHGDCSVCHYSGKEESEECQNCSNLKHVRCDIETPNSGSATVVFEGPDSYADGGGGICEVCHVNTLCYTNEGGGGSHSDNPDCVSCHPHGQPGGSFSAVASYGPQSHDTHIRGDKGPEIGACTDCHDEDNFSLFADGNSFTSTTVCDNCHSPGGAFNGVVMAKDSWVDGVYELNGLSLRSGKEQWCATCHDDIPANSKQDGTGISAPEKTGDNTTFGYYVTGHGATGAYNATLHGQNGPGYACTVCHDASSTHITGISEDSLRLKEVADDGLEYTLDVSEVCLDCHQVGQESQTGTLGYDATAEATVHSGAVSGRYNTEEKAEIAFPAYGDEADYEWNPGYQCDDCHEVHGTQKLAMVLPEIDGYVGGTNNLVSVAGLETTDADLTDLDPSATADDGLCHVCHTSEGSPHPDTNHAGNHHQGDTGDSCMDCHTHRASFFHCSDTGAGDGFCHATQQSHVTHTDSDNLKGPDIACGTCHDTNDYGYFADGASGDTALADTTVCDNCHSSTGVSMAKANWENGVYDNQYEHLPHWQEDTCYETGDIVLYGVPPLKYVALHSFTSLESFSSGNWEQIVVWQSNTEYTTGDLVQNQINTKIYRSKLAFTSLGSPDLDNWELVKRTGTGNDSLLEGKENWCATCHDDQPANSKADLTGVSAPEVLGDGSTYGFYVSGHGRPGIDQECLDCHNSTLGHIDHAHRTFAIQNDPYKVTHAYKDSYRLKENMLIPYDDPEATVEEAFNLCLEACHDPHAGVLSQIEYCETNFRGAEGNHAIAQYHSFHVEWSINNNSQIAFWDSDWDGSSLDSGMSCPACHNVHGSPMRVDGTLKSNPVMIRHGELISTPGTQDKVPALDFRWFETNPSSCGESETNILQDSLWGTYCNNQGEDGDGGFGNQHVCYGCHAGNFIEYYRIPGGTPGILATFAPMTIWTTDLANNSKDVFSPGEGIRYHLSFYLKGAMDGTEYCVKSENSGAYDLSDPPPANEDWDSNRIIIDTHLPRGQHIMHWDKTIPLNADEGTARYRMELKMRDPDCTPFDPPVSVEKFEDFTIQFQDPNDPPLPPTLTPEADTTHPSVTLEWSEGLCPGGDGLQYYVEVSDCEDFGEVPCVNHNSGWQPEPPAPPETHFDITLPVGTWHWRVKARNSVHTDRESSWSYPDSFEIQEPSSTPPPAPAPTPEPDTNTVSVTLEWSEVACPDGDDAEYYAEVDSTLFFTSPYSSGWQSGTGWQVTLPNTTTPTIWYWRVKARDSVHTNLESSWSSWDCFVRTLSPAPSLNDQENVASAVPVEVSLTWVAYDSFTNTPEYYVQVNDAADFSGPDNHTSGWLFGEQWNITLDANMTWYWRVKARDSVDNQLESFWSDADAFDIGPYIINESYEAGGLNCDPLEDYNYGYDWEGWEETIGYDSCSLLENCAVPGTPPLGDFGSQCLKSQALGTTYAAYADYSCGSEQAVTYTSFWVYVASEGVEHYEYKPLLVLFDGAGNTVFDFGLYAQWNHQINFRIRDWDSGGVVRYGWDSGGTPTYGFDAPELISMNRWYHIGIKYKYWYNDDDDEGYSWEWSIDGVPIVSVRDPAPYEDPFGRPMSAPLHGIQKWRVGLCHSLFNISSQSYPGVAYFDKLIVNSESFDIFMPALIPEPDTTDPAPATVILEWNAVTSPGGPNVEYLVQVDDDSDFSSPEYTSNWQTGTSLEVSGLALGTWHWRVMARDQGDNTLKSDWSWDSFDVHRPPPTPELIAELDISEPVPVSVTLEWNAVTDPDGDPVEYFVQVDTWANHFPGLASPYESEWISDTSWEVSLPTARTWYWRVRARDGNHPEAESSPAEWSTFVIYAPPTAPILTAYANVASDEPVEVTLEWGAVTCPDGDAPQYYAELWDASDLTDPVHFSGWQSQTGWTKTVDHDVDWLWRVQARDSVHTGLISDWSESGSFDVYLPIDSPTLTAETNSSDPVPVSVTLEWSGVTCPSGDDPEYYVEVDDASDFSSVDFNSGWQLGTNWEVSLPSAVTWHWRVLVRDSVETDWLSSWSTAGSFDIFGPPSAPTLTPEPDTSDPVPVSVTLEWGAVTCPDGDAVEYYVEVDDSDGFGSVNYSSGWQSGTSWGVSLPTAITWHWRVLARDSVHTDLESSWSTTDSFDVVPENGAPPSPTVIAAPDFCGPTPLGTPLAWNAVIDPEGDPVEYSVTMDDAADFSSPDFTSGWISGTQWSATDVTAGTWHWYVKARDAAHVEGESAWSDPDSFEVVSNSLVIEESFEGVGYELTWTESVGSGCSVDEDRTPLPDNPPTGLGSQYLRTYTSLSGNYNAAATYDHGTELSTTYASFYVNVYFPYPAWFVDGEQKHITLFKDGANAYVGGLSLYMDGTQLQLRVLLFNDGAWMISESHNIEGETWYKVDIRYDDMDNTWEWRVDGTVVDSGLLVGDHRTGIQYWTLGPWDDDQQEYIQVRYDLFKVGTECFSRVTPPSPTVTDKADFYGPLPATTTLEWNEVIDPDGDPVEYAVQVDNDSDFSSPEHTSDWQFDPAWDVDIATAGTWYWRVKARDAVQTGLESDWSDSDAFVLYSSNPPPTPTVIGEPDVSQATPALITLEWNEVIDPDGDPVEYLVEVYDVYKLYHSDSGWISDLGWDFSASVPRTWYWRVQARDGTNTDAVSAWSSEDSFVLYGPPSAPLKTPEPDVVATLPVSVTLEWNAVTCPDGDGVEYYVQVGDNSDYSGVTHNSGWQSGQSWEVELAQATTWYWRVRARDEVHTDLVSSWSSILSNSFDVAEP
ncbi:MAG: cytochrome c3 family protein [Thermodesulfobacteriota bacterium]|nr:cytochrome c3 family protein [Thermodesulfobacteriota bacterium]